jgi:class 3 adenylate cyclase
MNSQSPPSIHYEVYTQDGTRWNLHARYERNEREAALNDAKNVERTLQIPAKVVREIYYPANNRSEETLVYAGDNQLRAKALARANATPKYRGGGSGWEPRAGGGLKGNLANEAAGSLGSAAKLMVVVAASLTIAGVATSMMNFALDPLAGQLSDAADSLILFTTFLVTFVLTALPLSTSLLNRSIFDMLKSEPKRRGPPPPMPTAKPIIIEPPPEEIEAEEELDWEDLKDEDEALPPIEDEEPEAAPVEDVAAEEVAAQAEPAEPSESGATIFLHFVNGLIGAVKKVRPVLDAYNLFGVDLMMAGAIDLLGQQKTLPTEERRQVLKGAIEAMGVKAATAQAFADKYEEYLGEQRYMPMILSGRSTMESFLAGHDTLSESVAPAFEQWNRPQSQAPAAAARIMTVMFTDMVGSTDLTQAQGDKAAQHLVRRHNVIVRNALAQYSGKEIKHTGDGIMASFGSSANGVEAAIAIQRAIAKNNAQHPEQELHIRIGINAGEPIEEEEDLFGTTVQLAARVCARCDTDEILCSNVVKELASGRGLNFTSFGAQSLKGFKEQIMLFSVTWRE